VNYSGLTLDTSSYFSRGPFADRVSLEFLFDANLFRFSAPEVIPVRRFRLPPETSRCSANVERPSPFPISSNYLARTAPRFHPFSLPTNNVCLD